MYMLISIILTIPNIIYMHSIKASRKAFYARARAS